MNPDDLKVLYEDNHLLIVYKPSGILTQPSGTFQPNLEQVCKEWIKQKYHKPGQVFLEVIHRIDKPVSGIVAFAKTSKALARLQAYMREKKIVRIYEAWVEGTLPSDEGILEHYLVHDDYRAKVVDSTCKEAKKAKLHYQVIERQPGKTRLKIELETGRYHQIRVQLAEIGCPILGDFKYGSQASWSDGIALQHTEMRLPHPVTHEQIILKLSEAII
jgi:23S rRNA pseudouridine1911/1915/1917 synthase